MKVLFLSLFIIFIPGCSGSPWLDGKKQSIAYLPSSVHDHVEHIGKRLFEESNNVRRNRSVAVGTFLPISNLSGKSLPGENEVGQQIQESFVTLCAQAGMRVVEFKTTKTIMLHHNQDVMLSRKIAEMASDRVATDYYLTGTYAQKDRGIVVNARLIEVATSSVVAASTGQIPLHVLGGLTTSGSVGASARSQMYQIAK